MQLFAEKLKNLGHIFDKDGIIMDPNKVDQVINWRTPTNKDLLHGFLGLVQCLASDCKGVGIPIGHLSDLTGSTKKWQWGEMKERAFQDVKEKVDKWRKKPLNCTRLLTWIRNIKPGN